MQKTENDTLSGSSHSVVVGFGGHRTPRGPRFIDKAISFLKKVFHTRHAKIIGLVVIVFVVVFGASLTYIVFKDSQQPLSVTSEETEGGELKIDTDGDGTPDTVIPDSEEQTNSPTGSTGSGGSAGQSSAGGSTGSGGGGSTSGGGSSSGGGSTSSTWPDATNTGRAASGCTSYQNVSSPTGYFNIGADYDDQPFVDIQADGTWVIDCIITDSIFLVYQPKTTFRGVEISASPGENAAIQFRTMAHSGKVLYSTIHAVSPSQQMQYAVLDMSTHGLHLKGNNFYWWSDAVQLGGNDILIEDNWMHDPVYYTNDHTDAIQHFGGGQNVTIRHNRLTVDLAYMGSNGNQTAALALFQDGGAGENSYNNVLVEDNLVGGGGYAFYCGYEKVKDPVTNVKFRNNKILTSIWPNGGYWGPKAAEPTWGQNGNEWTGNTWYDGPNAGQTIL